MKNNNKDKNKKRGKEVSSNKVVCTEAVQAKPLQVIVYKNNFEKAFRAFRAVVQKERILSLYKEKGLFEKPSDKRRRKRNEAARERLSQDRKDKKNK